VADFLQLLSSGLATGAIYALAATGFTLLWQASGAVNFAQGDFVMLPAFFILAAIKLLDFGFGWSIAVGLVASLVVLGILFKRVLVDPLLRHGTLPFVVATIALGLFLREATKLSFGAEALPFPALVPATPVRLGTVTFSLQDLSILVVATAAIVLLQVFLARTRTGRCMQAVAQNRALAVILGVPIGRMVLYTFLLNAALVCLASILISPIYLAKFSNGESLGLIAFTAAIVGGFNQVRGAILGGFVVGIADNLTAAYVSTQYRSALPLVLLIVIILLRPQGLLGRVEERAV
jgi:branched-chain amino acid transport system permease protein